MQKTSVKIINDLRSAGFEAYWAGGCVRDTLMNREPKDYDIVTSAKPGEIERVIKKTIPIGKKFGVIVAVENGHHFEIATFRSDSSYTDGRRPDAVFFTDAKEDASRRDFTINGVFYDPISKKIIDYVGGQRDIEKKILRFIGNPLERIAEDNLRILRAIRFKNLLGFSYAPGVFSALKKGANLILNVSFERIRDEMEKILVMPGREHAIKDLDRVGILKYILPELLDLKNVHQPEKYHKEGDVFTHTLMALSALPSNVSSELAWATLFHDIGKSKTFKRKERIRFDGHAEVGAEMLERIAIRLKFSRNLKENIGWLIRHHMMAGDVLNMKRVHQTRWVHSPLFPELLELLRADSLGSKPKSLVLYRKLKNLLDRKEELLPMPEKLLSGSDVMSILDINKGVFVGRILEQVHNAQVNGNVSTRDDAIKLVRKIGKNEKNTSS